MKKKPPPDVADEPSGFYVRLPLPPEVLAALKQHAANLDALAAVIGKTGFDVRELIAAATKTVSAAEKDVRRARRALARRR